MDDQRFDLFDEMDGLLNGPRAFSGAPVYKIGPGQDAVFHGHGKSLFHFSVRNLLVQKISDFFGTALHSVADLNAACLSHPKEDIFTHVIDPGYGHPRDVEFFLNDFFADSDHQFFVHAEGVVREVEKIDPLFVEALEFIHKVLWAVKPDLWPPKFGGSAECAFPRAAPSQRQVLILKIF